MPSLEEKERKGKGAEVKPKHVTPDGRQKALGHCGEEDTEGDKATELPDSHSHRKM